MALKRYAFVVPLVKLIIVVTLIIVGNAELSDLLTRQQGDGSAQGGICWRSTCNWMSWHAWTQCSRSCGHGGTRSRERALCCRRNEDWWSCTARCNLNPSDNRQTERCNERCFNGGTFENNRCTCRESHFDSCCGQIIDCGHPGQINDGNVQLRPWRRTTFGSTATYSCNRNFNLTSGDHERQCSRRSMNQNVGYWTGRQPRCAYVNSCQSRPCDNGASCENLLDTYECHCAHGFGGSHCEFDILPPYMEGCPDNRHHRTRELLLQVGWEEPEFHDPFGNEVTTQTNLENPSILPWGPNNVVFTGTKENNGLSTECHFTETIKPYPCDDLPVPVNGSVACNNWHTDYARVCAYFCNKAYTFPIAWDIKQLMVCVSSGKWLPVQEFPQCSVAVASFEKPNGNYFHGECDTAKEEIQRTYIELLQAEESPFRNLCNLFKSDCAEQNVTVYC